MRNPSHAPSLGRPETRGRTDRAIGLTSAGKIGMWIFLVSDAFAFAGLLIGYGVLRNRQAIWRPADQPALGVQFTAALTFLLISSSLTMVLALARAVQPRRTATLTYLLATLSGGVLFLFGQLQEVIGLFGGPGLVGQGLSFRRSAYASSFYVITSFHGLHVLIGVLLLGMIGIQSRRDLQPARIEIVGLYWHFVDLIWILVFTFVYLI